MQKELGASSGKLRKTGRLIVFLCLATLIITGFVAVSNLQSVYAKNVKPVITSLAPTQGAALSTLVINGSDFGAKRHKHMDRVRIGSYVAPVKSWSDTKIVVMVPNMPVGTYNVWVRTPHGRSNTYPFNVISVPHLNSLNPSDGKVGDPVQIAGSGFSYEAKKVTFTSITDTYEAVFTVVDDTKINATVPDLIPGVYNVQVTTDGGTSNGLLYTVISELAPSISMLLPDHGLPGTLIGIHGNNFGYPRGTSVVKFGDTEASSYYSWWNTEIMCYVPTTLASGSYEVTVVAPNGTSNARTFTVTP